MKYFAYGSNCNPAIMEKKQVRYTSRQRASLRGYQILFNKRALREKLPEVIGFANINEAHDHCVEGILYDVVDRDVTRLDESERYPEHYDRVLLQVEVDGQPHEAWVYQAQPDKVATGLVPSRNYLNHILAARDFLSRQYYEALDKSQTYSGECACCHTHGEVVFIKDLEQMYTLCQSCRESRIMWGDVRGRRLTVPETEAVMMQLVKSTGGFASITALIQEAIAIKLIDP